MPIRFHCPPCGQLLGIARRKAGTQVQCPACRAWVLVPSTSEAEFLPKNQPAPQHSPINPPSLPLNPDPEPLFERINFEELLHGSTDASPAGLPPLPSSAGGAGAPQDFDVEHLPAAELTHSPARPLVLVLLIVLLMVLSFGAGILVGRYLL
jgi:hypothetical protein